MLEAHILEVQKLRDTLIDQQHQYTGAGRPLIEVLTHCVENHLNEITHPQFLLQIDDLVKQRFEVLKLAYQSINTLTFEILRHWKALEVEYDRIKFLSLVAWAENVNPGLALQFHRERILDGKNVDLTTFLDEIRRQTITPSKEKQKWVSSRAYEIQRQKEGLEPLKDCYEKAKAEYETLKPSLTENEDPKHEPESKHS